MRARRPVTAGRRSAQGRARTQPRPRRPAPPVVARGLHKTALWGKPRGPQWMHLPSRCTAPMDASAIKMHGPRAQPSVSHGPRASPARDHRPEGVMPGALQREQRLQPGRRRRGVEGGAVEVRRDEGVRERGQHEQRQARADAPQPRRGVPAVGEVDPGPGREEGGLRGCTRARCYSPLEFVVPIYRDSTYEREWEGIMTERPRLSRPRAPPGAWRGRASPAAGTPARRRRPALRGPRPPAARSAVRVIPGFQTYVQYLFL
jgi:hypothetical protein